MMRDWQHLYEKIGPLRYQASNSDCVPTTIINGLAILMESKLHPKLHQLIGAVAGDQDKNGGTGFVSCDTLSVLLSKWFQRAYQDNRADGPLPFTSEIIESTTINLDKRGKLLQCLSRGGVACLVTGKKSDHYSLLIGTENDNFLGFDCWWDGRKTARRIEKFIAYKGIVNIQWTRDELEKELQQSGWVHLLGRK